MKKISENNLFKKFRAFIDKNKLIVKDEIVLLAVSGGMDSIVMCHLFSLSKYKFVIAHCNFSLRGNESDEDSKFAGCLAENYRVKFHSEKFETEKFADENGWSIQEAARELRYKYFKKLLIKYKYDKIATGHHLDDSIETFFINIMRGSGPAGLRGIPVKNGTVIRPLLFATRNEIENYASDYNLSYRQDSSNFNDDYLRNRIRHHIIPLIKKDSESFESKMKELMENLSAIHDLSNRNIETWKKNNVIREKDDTTRIPIEKILQEDKPEAFLSLLLHSEGMNGAEADKILTPGNTGRIFTGKNQLLLYDRQYLVLAKKSSATYPVYALHNLPAEVNHEHFSIRLHETRRRKNDKIIMEENVFSIDRDKIRLPLVLRTWKQGDYFFPLGMKGRKKISNYFTDKKIDRFQKDRIYLLLSDNDIVCILGHQIDDRYKITALTKKILTIELALK